MSLKHFWRDLDWNNWVYGLISGAVGGGANAVYAGFGAMVIDPKDFSLGSTKSFKLMGMVFLFSAALSAFLYLKQKPLPDIIPVSEKMIVEMQPLEGTGDGTLVKEGQGMLKKTTMEKVEIVPIPPAPPPPKDAGK